MAPKFGTSGLRGLVTELTSELVADHIRAFVQVCDTGGIICVGRDLRPSSPRLAQDVAEAARGMGCRVIDCGAVPTPALALAAMGRGAGAVMVTGSHIPADRNGLKFYTPSGEITKEDETAITAHLGTFPKMPLSETDPVQFDPDVGALFIQRYVSACGAEALKGSRIGLYSHSAVGRDLLAGLLTRLGADVIELGRSDDFIPVDTEAVEPQVRTQIAQWVAVHNLDALVSTDGDSDRPLLADDQGRIVPGDILGQITAETLGAAHVVTPISSNSGVTMKGFDEVQLTRIGSPFVIAAMQTAGGKVVGYEANGGFLLGFEAQGPTGPFAPLMTRDCVLPLVMGLIAARGGTLSHRVAAEPPVVTMAERLQNIPRSRAQPFVDSLATQAAARKDFLDALGVIEERCDLTDGVRITLQDGAVLHIRPSGNAPELRLYAEAKGRTQVETLLQIALKEVRAQMVKAD